MFDDKIIEAPVKHPTEVAKLVPAYFWYGNIKNWKLHFPGDSIFANGLWAKAKEAANAMVQRKQIKVVKQ